MKKIDALQKRSISGSMHTYPYISAYLGNHGRKVWEAYYRKNGECFHSGWMYNFANAFGTWWYSGDLACYRHF